MSACALLLPLGVEVQSSPASTGNVRQNNMHIQTDLKAELTARAVAQGRLSGADTLCMHAQDRKQRHNVARR